MLRCIVQFSLQLATKWSMVKASRLRDIHGDKQHNSKRKKDDKGKQVPQTISTSLCRRPSHWVLPSLADIEPDAFVESQACHKQADLETQDSSKCFPFAPYPVCTLRQDKTKSPKALSQPTAQGSSAHLRSSALSQQRAYTPA